MPFPTTLTSQQLADIRNYGETVTDYRRAYWLATPESIVFQASINGAVSGQDYAELTFDNVTTGAFGDIKNGMTVIVHSDSDDIDSFLFEPTYVRGSATSSTIPIGWTAVDIADNSTVTVIDDYRLHARQVRADSNVLFHDYDNLYAPLPPAIYGLQSVYAINSSTASSIDFAPTVEAMESGASISTYLWDVGDGTITTGTSASKDITVSFPAWSSGATDGWRWVSLTATDDNSESTTFNFQVFVGNFDSASWAMPDVLLFDTGSQMSEGALASITLGTSASNLYKSNHIACVVDESNTTIVSNVLFLGRIRQLADENIAQYIEGAYGIQITQSTTYEVEGYGAELDRLPMPYYPLKHDDSADDWHEVKDLSLARAIWYGLVHLTTAPTIIAFNLNTSTYHNYQNVGFELDNGSALSSSQRLADLVGARLIFARSGEVELLEDGVLKSTADRATLDTVANFNTDDFLERVSVQQPARPLAGQITATHGGYTSSNNRVELLRVKAPKIPNTLGISDRQVDLLLDSDETPSVWIAEASVRTANYLASLNETDVITVRLKDGYWFITPHNQRWYTITESFQSGLSYDTNTRWILNDCSLSIQAVQIDGGGIVQDWRFETTFKKETQDEGTASSFAFAPRARPYTIPQVPTIAISGSNYTPENAYEDEESEDLTADTGAEDTPTPINPPDDAPKPAPNRDVLFVPFTGETVTMAKTPVDGNTYTVTVTDTGIIAQSIASIGTVTFEDAGGYDDYTVVAGSIETLVDKVLRDLVSLGAGNPRVAVRIDATETVNFTGVSYQQFARDLTGFGDGEDPANTRTRVKVLDSGLNVVADTGEIDGTGAVAVESAESQTISGTGQYLELEVVVVQKSGPASKDLYIDDVQVSIGSADVQADAFYKFEPSVESLGTDGLQRGVGAVGTPPYKGNHTYTFTFTGNGTAQSFSFSDPDGDTSDNSGGVTLVIEGEF